MSTAQKFATAKPRVAPAYARLAKPTSAADIARICLDLKHFPSPVRALGAGTAQTRCSDATGGTQLDMSALNRVLKLDTQTVTVQPGITLAELADVLGNKGLELIGGFDLANRTVGGAVSAVGLEAAAAGTLDTFISSVVQLKFVSSEGKKYCVNRRNMNLLTLLRFSYGLLGIIYEVTLRVRPIQAFKVRAAAWEIEDLEVLTEQFRALDAGVKLKIFPFRNRVHCEYRESSDTSETGARLAWRIKAWTVNAALPGAAYALAKMMPLPKLRYPCIDSIEAATETIVSKGPFSPGSTSTEQKSQTGFLRDRLFTFSSWVFDERRFAQVVTDYRNFCREHYSRTGYRCDMPTVGYRLPKDRSSLFSPSFETAMISLTPMSTKHDAWDDFAFEFSEFAMRNAGFPIFSQTRHLPPDYLLRALPQRLTFFKKARRQFDPQNRFLNHFFAGYMLD